jgi:biopolymer transport protein TolQ
MQILAISLGSNPFFDAYTQSDFLGKMIIIGLILLSILSWSVLIHKVWLTRRCRQLAGHFKQTVQMQRLHPLGVDCDFLPQEPALNPFKSVYWVLKKQTIDLLNKNRHFSNTQQKTSQDISYLSPTDIGFIEAHLSTSITGQIKQLEKNLYILSTTVSLAPFLGLLGTVWGILMTFGELQNGAAGSSSQMVIGGLSLALATTVMGLMAAIPALIGYNYLKTDIRDFETDMEEFATEGLASVELQYRQVDVS